VNRVEVVGALIRDPRNRVYVHRRSPNRRLFPGIWDVVGGHVEPGESAREALAREVWEETGWRVRRVDAVLADWEWEYAGARYHELDYLVDVAGDVSAPRLEVGKHDAYAWVGPGELELLMVGRTDGDRRLRDIVARAVRTRLTDRLVLTPVGPYRAGDLYRLHWDRGVACWYGGRWTAQMALDNAADMARSWETGGVHKWLAYERSTGALVGRGGLSRSFVDGAERLEVGWALLRERWGHGYATEIGQAALAFAFDDLGADEVVGFTEPHNTRSRRVMERLGMRYERDIHHRGEPFVLYRAGTGVTTHPAGPADTRRSQGPGSLPVSPPS
jgi:RimJ/RimL family protein N-acetyltransferase